MVDLGPHVGDVDGVELSKGSDRQSHVRRLIGELVDRHAAGADRRKHLRPCDGRHDSVPHSRAENGRRRGRSKHCHERRSVHDAPALSSTGPTAIVLQWTRPGCVDHDDLSMTIAVADGIVAA